VAHYEYRNPNYFREGVMFGGGFFAEVIAISRDAGFRLFRARASSDTPPAKPASR
jgi:hypothetical protein